MYEDIKSQFKEVIIASQGIPNPQIDKLFKDWEVAKKRFIELFGGLIYEWPQPIEFVLDEAEQQSRATSFANDVYIHYHNEELSNFIDKNVKSFFENKVSYIPDNSKVPKGTKLIKAFKYFEDDPATLRHLQDKASQLIQENKIKGTLCFSVHPLDFLSSSENTYNWRSCHALDGEYRAGNLSYMVDDATFMVYLKGADHIGMFNNFGGVQWNSKKWRVLMHESSRNNIIFAGRQYPFPSKNGIDIALNIYNNLIVSYREKNINDWYYDYAKYAPWESNYVDTIQTKEEKKGYLTKLSTRYLLYGSELLSIDDIVIEGPCALNYNDILKSTCYTEPYYAIFDKSAFKTTDWIRRNPVQVGGEVMCLHCGENIIHNPETMRCDYCEEEYGFEENDYYGRCECCGRRIYLEDASVVGDNEEYLCEACVESECFICDECGELHYNSEANYLADPGEWYCNYCYNEILELRKEKEKESK